MRPRAEHRPCHRGERYDGIRSARSLPLRRSPPTATKVSSKGIHSIVSSRKLPAGVVVVRDQLLPARERDRAEHGQAR